MSPIDPSPEAPSDPSPGEAFPPEAPPADVGDVTPSPAPFSTDSWGPLARAAVLAFLLGMALAVLVRLSASGGAAEEFLSKNEMPMAARMSFLSQMLGAGFIAALVPLGLALSRTRYRVSAALCEEWAWFLSPLILLPAIPVVLRHEVWHQKHEDLLPVVLFGVLIAEVLISRASAHIPARVVDFWERFWESDSSTPERSWIEKFELFLKKHGPLLSVCAAALAYGAFMSFYTVRWHHKLGTAIFDLGINNNLMFGGLEGHFNESTIIFPDDPKMYFANHVKIGIYAFLPIYALIPRPETLLVIQSISVGLGAIPLFLFARRRLPELWALALAFSYLAYYPLHGANFYEMKEPTTAASIALACIWAIDGRRYVLGSVFFLWALIMREDMPIPLAVVGTCFLLSGARPRAGLIMAVVAAAWFVLLRFRLMEDVGSWWFPNMYEDLWAPPERGFRSVLKTLVSNPTYTLRHIFIEKKFWYLMHLMVPLAFLPVRRWWGWAALVPGAILTLLVTDYEPPIMFSFQYVMYWAPYCFIAATLILSSMRKELGGIHRARGALAALCLSTLALSFNFGAFSRRDGALSAGYHKITFSFTEKERKTLADVRRLVASIPAKASVASTEKVGAHLSSRYAFYTLRRGVHGAEYIVARKSELRLDRTKESVKKALVSGEYGLVGRFGDFCVFKKGAKTDQNPTIIDEWQLGSSQTRKPRRGLTEERSESSDFGKAELANGDENAK